MGETPLPVITGIVGLVSGLAIAYFSELFKDSFKQKSDKRKRTQDLIDEITLMMSKAYNKIDYIMESPPSLPSIYEHRVNQLEGVGEDYLAERSRRFQDKLDSLRMLYSSKQMGSSKQYYIHKSKIDDYADLIEDLKDIKNNTAKEFVTDNNTGIVNSIVDVLIELLPIK